MKQVVTVWAVSLWWK